jgi:hypothetical protein
MPMIENTPSLMFVQMKTVKIGGSYGGVIRRTGVKRVALSIEKSKFN